MSELQKDFLFILIKSLTTSEKRQFKLYVNRLGINIDAKFLLLFSVLDKMKDYDETVILEKKISTKQQLSNLKAHLYKQILISLRLNPSHQNYRIQLREQLDFANILYQKGLYKQALKILDKVKQTALDLDEKSIASEIIDLEKIIESQYITRSIAGRADELIRQSEAVSKQNNYTLQLSNLSLKLYSEMLAHGYVNNDEDRKRILCLFQKGSGQIIFNELKFTEKLWFYKAHVWKNQLLQDYKYAFKYSYLWVDLFYKKPEMIVSHPVWYIKGNTYLLKTLFILGNIKLLEIYFRQFTETIRSNEFSQNENTQLLIFLTYANTSLNVHFVKAEFFLGTKIIPEIEMKMDKMRDKIDEHHFMILYLKMAAMFFGARKFQSCIIYASKILESKGSIQEDLLFHTRILILMARIEIGNDDDYDDFVKSTEKFIQKLKRPEDFHFECVQFFKKINDCGDTKVIENQYEKFDETLNIFSKNEYYRRSLMYLDIHGWVRSKIEKMDVVDVIKEKYKHNRK